MGAVQVTREDRASFYLIFFILNIFGVIVSLAIAFPLGVAMNLMALGFSTSGLYWTVKGRDQWRQ